METINQYNWLFFVIPFALVIIGAWFLDLIPNRSVISSSINGFLNIIAEKNVGELMLYNGFGKTEVSVFQKIRIGFSVIGALLLALTFGSDSFTRIAMFCLIAFAFYKLVYIWLLMTDNARIRRMNILLPYALKTLSYLVYQYPVLVAIKKAIPAVPKEYRHDFEVLYEDFYRNPNSTEAFDNMVNRYHGRLENLDSYFRLFYRLHLSGTKGAEETLNNLNRMLSESMNIAREEKYEVTNRALGYWGLLPVALLTIALIGCLLIFVQNMNLG